ncbi:MULTISPECIES: transcription-repair coupling factor [unclassified Gilliamella]|uniref:transcription-repair coupling factor n=1 Tax=unclassified Gilliamella TaxID=2685620 RepID=UPI00226AFAE9|nr:MULTISPECIES: transcription-repair coupling factor [unclassified Gilliamella]MCX8642898.1 transcription-repair coupling factor [Gilliamella sp. B3835]MCX8708330.1 transcription-repair coupling factor [Gilliamella sp. B3783]MCX8709957.1 transcription-repair coupling factor [Gilliamella sp. B3780]MCX8714269.1 transcription-repair coupling factor [Gilliamella sp. B3781]MCX8717485.1 transcription-repair coupling factor [Gilliamella sp. B3784]
MPKTINLSTLIPQKPGDIKHCGQLVGSALSLFCAQAIQAHNGLVVIITDDMQQTSRIHEELKQFSPFPSIFFPDWETLPYDSFSPHQDIVSARLSCLYHLGHLTKGALILPINTLMQKVCPQSFLGGHVFMMKKGLQISREHLRLQLENAGYRSVSQVMEHGEYATRGALFDIFPMGSDKPYRIDFFDDEIDSIRTFDVESQRTFEEIEQIQLLPAHEFPFDKAAIELFRSQWREQFAVRLEPESIYQQVSKNILPTGIEYWQALFFNEPLVPLFSYFLDNTLIINTANIEQFANKYWQDINQRYESRQVDPMRPLLSPSVIWSKTDEIFAQFKHYPRLIVANEALSQSTKNINLPFSALPDVAIQIQHKDPYFHFEQFNKEFAGKIIFSVESEGRKEALQEILGRLRIYPTTITQLDQLDNINDRFCVIVGASEQGFIDLQHNFAFITENELLGRRIIRRKKESKQSINTDSLIRSLAELTPGKPVVHLEHGVGRYAGLTTLETGGITAEYLILLYANETKLYVPVSSLNLISRYSGGDEENAPLNKLGTDAWSKARQKAAEKVRDVAAELLDIYAERESKPGFEFKQDREQYKLFCEAFPYQETEDQQNAIGAVIGDMCSPYAMDRLVCGDVGFGKTEVAIRAAFLAVINHKQAAVLVPTTLLAQQHYENFCDRFANWPIRIESLSRFKTAKQQQAVIQALAEGKVDIVIGTHKLLQEDVKWKDLGLLIVDEEHRFGVRQKERIKAMRANIDILTLTATPIPRTLNMAMSGMRDLSIIATPPARRLAVKTFVREYDDLVIREAILREILRGGQIYYLHNDVSDIEAVAEKLAELVPEARIAIGHGQMHERDLERIMNDFHHQRFNLLVCTTIVETGIDIPNANTIIIERADKFGLAQLHQLRGRVGRSYHQAYAYLLTPHPKLLSKDAKKRLDAIATLEDLGAGFALATHDLEIRGAGELLGSDQSGQIETIGFNLYIELLEDAVKSLKEGKEPTLESLLNNQQTEIELRLPTLIPDDFIPDVNTRLSLYKRIASVDDLDELTDIQVEMRDRFGQLPDAVLFLLDITKIRHHASQLGITKIELGEKGGFIEFGANNKISVDYLIEMIQKAPKNYRLEGTNRLKLLKSELQRLERIEYIKNLLVDFAKHQA